MGLHQYEKTEEKEGNSKAGNVVFYGAFFSAYCGPCRFMDI